LAATIACMNRPNGVSSMFSVTDTSSMPAAFSV
jgi:hypothetical protein